MNKYSSLYIDLIRISASLGVFLGHLSLNYFSGFTFMPYGTAHHCVVIFFVLSGYLISFTTERNKKDLPRYTSDRLSRLYSVVFPALLFTYFIDGIGRQINSQVYSMFLNVEYQPFKFIINLLFLQQSSFFNTNPSTNNPFWSLSYEFWYYAFFGACVYLKGWKRYLIIPLIAFVMGIKILLLFPVWLIGAGAFYLSNRIKINNSLSIFFFFLTLALLIWIISNSIKPFPLFGRVGHAPYFYSANFLNDALSGFIVGCNLLFLSKIKTSWKGLPEPVENRIKYVSAATFTLYVFHFPLLVFIKAVINYNALNLLHNWLVILFILVFVLAITGWLEKNRVFYSRFFNKLLQVNK